VELHSKIRVRIREKVGGVATHKLTQTTVGRALLSEIMPDGMGFEQINRTMNKRAISATINMCYRQIGLKETVVL
jgi:DNA-directed RNA polymerase subunit beta'